MEEPIWVLLDVVKSIHKRQIAEHGGLDGVRDLSALESAIFSPRNWYYYQDPKPSLSELATSYAYSISRNHPFNGNKRVALIVCELFLELNHLSLKAKDSEKYDYFLALAANKVSREPFNEWIKSRITH